MNWRGDEAVLDVGCGSGMLLNGAAAKLTTGKAIGIDVWATNSGGGDFDLLMRNIKAEGVMEHIEFQEVDAKGTDTIDAAKDKPKKVK